MLCDYLVKPGPSLPLATFGDTFLGKSQNRRQHPDKKNHRMLRGAPVRKIVDNPPNSKKIDDNCPIPLYSGQFKKRDLMLKYLK
jgi:hypothetical protein